MAIIVGTNSYVTLGELETYASERGIELSVYGEIALTKAMDYLETRSWKGAKYDYTQSLEWPRLIYSNCSSYPSSYYYYCEDQSVVPENIKKAQMVAAVMIDSGADIQATVDRLTKREKVDVLEIEYTNGSSTAFYTAINDLIAPYISSANLRTNRV